MLGRALATLILAHVSPHPYLPSQPHNMFLEQASGTPLSTDLPDTILGLLSEHSELHLQFGMGSRIRYLHGTYPICLSQRVCLSPSPYNTWVK